MLKTFDEIRNDVIVKLGITTTTAYYTDARLNDWIQQAERWATSYKKWVMTEGVQTTTYTGTERWDFEGLKSDSIRILDIDGKLFRKLNYEDYLIFKEKTPESEDRVFSDYGRVVYINDQNGLSGTLTVRGQYTPLPIDVTDLTAETVFSAGEEEGNEAIVEKVLSYANTREKKLQEAKFHSENAIAILEKIDSVIDEEQFKYQTHEERGGMWERVDVVNGQYYKDRVKRDQF